MEKEDKLELYNALANGLPYGLKVECNGSVYDLWMLGMETALIVKPFMSELEAHPIEEIKPYLRPFANMSRKDFRLLGKMTYGVHTGGTRKEIEAYGHAISFLNERHIDYRKLIEKGVAIKAPEGMYGTLPKRPMMERPNDDDVRNVYNRRSIKNKRMKKNNTLVVNLFAGPGAGKSTGAAYIFSRLKLLGYDCEYVSEFAKDKVWEQNDAVFDCQFYISGKQVFKIKRCYGKVDIIVTDSPIAIGAQYLKEDESKLGAAILEEFGKYDNMNFFINRVKEYNPNGRNQTLEEAVEIDGKIKKWMTENDIAYKEIDGDESGYDKAIRAIEEIARPRVMTAEVANAAPPISDDADDDYYLTDYPIPWHCF